MPKLTGTEGVTAQDAAGGGGSRISRLEALKARRREMASQTPEVTIGAMKPGATEPVAPVAPVAPPTGPRPRPETGRAAPIAGAGLSLQKLGLAGGGAKSQELQRAIRKNAARLMQILSKTPADAAGHLDGTPFTMTGIAKLAQMLRDRAADKGGPGSKIATMALTFLGEADPSRETVHGLSAAKIRSLWQRAEQIAFKGGKSPLAVPAEPRLGHGGGPATLAAPVRPASGGAGSGGQARGLPDAQKRLFDSALKIMETTPADSDGLVPGTRFTQAGVGRVIDLLQAKATAADPKIAKAARAALRLIATEPGEAEAVRGASVRKLQTLAARSQSLRS